jgi:L-ascorbate metabolism protein UlaG (beta-lactamase superfamily)
MNKVIMRKIATISLLFVFLAGCSPAQPEDLSQSLTTPEVSVTTAEIIPTITVMPSPTLYFQQDTPESYINPTPESDLAGMQVMYVGNSGVLITVGDQKVLIDGLFEGFNEECSLTPDVFDQLVNAQAPFDDIDLILATHDHADHFNIEPVRQYLQLNQNAVFASTAQVTVQLSEFGDRIVTLDAFSGNPAQVDINGIQVEAIYLSHGTVSAGEVETINNGYVISINGFSFFHTGDIDINLIHASDLQAYGIPDMDLDVLFIPHFILIYPYYRPLIEDSIHSRYIVAIHYQCTEPPNRRLIEQTFPGTIFFTEPLETWGIP